MHQVTLVFHSQSVICHSALLPLEPHLPLVCNPIAMRYGILSVVVLLSTCVARGKHGTDTGKPGVNQVEDAQAPSPSISLASTTPSTVMSSSIASPIPSSPPFHWVKPTNLTTCQNATFLWDYTSSDELLLTIMVTNERVAQQGPGLPPPPHPESIPLFMRTLSATISPKRRSEIWGTVDVPQGWYVAIAFDTDHFRDLFSRSSPFFVQTGEDTICLPPTDSTTPTPPLTTPTSSLPEPPESSKPHMTTGRLVGAIGGVVVGVSLIAIAFNVPCIWKRFLPPPKPRYPGGPSLLY
ncbi:hypothetical protein ONZ45_g15118 [Pleurotus djamor]|nr:hypothetical protein ONZ45_g15118 [Pleurotus djamor]